MFPSTNTFSDTTTPTEAKTNSPSDLPHVTQTDFATTIKDLLANFDDKLKEYLKETIAYQDTKFDEKLEK